MPATQRRFRFSRNSHLFLGLILVAYGGSYTLFLRQHPILLVNFFGVLALVFYGISLYPGIVRTVLPEIKTHPSHRWALKYRRQIGVASFCFALTHTILAFLLRGMDLMDPMTYIRYATGLSSFAIMIVLTATSNDWSVRLLKKTWAKVHRLTYALVLILPFHVLATMKDDWTSMTPISALFVSLIAVLFLQRLVIRT